jgi:hypothetical protein
MPRNLRDEMDSLAKVSIEQTLDEDSSMQTLFLIKPDDALIVCALAVGAGPEIARVARLLVWEHEPVMAVLQTEGWSVMASPGETDPDRLAVMRGTKAPSEIPEHKRDEVMIMYGETPDGESLHLMWQIVTKGGIRDLVALPQAGHVVSRFQPLFIVDTMLRDVEDMVAGKPGATDPLDLSAAELELLRQSVPPLEKRRKVIRQLVGETLRDGGGGTSRVWQEDLDKREKYFEDWDARAHE